MSESSDLPLWAPLDSACSADASKVTRADVVAEARTWLDTPFVHQHRAKGIGVDCAGLVIGVSRELGLVAKDFDVTAYPTTPDGTTLLAICDRFMTRVPMNLLRPGNVLVIQFQTKPQHLGIVGDYLYGGLSLIQAQGAGNGGRVTEWRLEERKGWKHVQAYALRGVVEG